MQAKLSALCVLGAILVPSVCRAVPDLQLHIPGGTYYESRVISDGSNEITVTESWFTDQNPFALQVVGADKKSNKQGAITSLTLYLSVPEMFWDESGSISIKGGTIDTTISAADFSIGIPDSLDGKKTIPPHGIFPTSYYALSLPDFAFAGGMQYICDYNEDYEEETSTPTGTLGLIQEYEISYSGFYHVHFDLAGLVNDKMVFAPFSHDADGPPAPVPEPATLFLFGTGLAGFGFVRSRRKQC